MPCSQVRNYFEDDDEGGDDGAENLGYTAILSVWHQGDNYRKLPLDFRHFFTLIHSVLHFHIACVYIVSLMWHYTQGQLQPIKLHVYPPGPFPNP